MSLVYAEPFGTLKNLLQTVNILLFEFYFILYLGCNGKEKRYKRSILENEDITKDRETFEKNLKNALDRRLSNVQRDKTLTIFEIFDAQNLVKSSAGKCQLEKFIAISQREK